MEKKIAPTFCLFNQNDERICLENFRGKWVILYFYPKDNSKSCTLEALSFTDNLKSFKNMDAVVVGVSPDSVKSHKNFVHKHNLDFILLSDPEKYKLSKRLFILCSQPVPEVNLESLGIRKKVDNHM